jgi:hypothetical protein
MPLLYYQATNLSATTLIEPVVSINPLLNADCVSQIFYTSPRRCYVFAVRYIHTTAGTAAGTVTLDLVRCSGTTTVANGTSLLDTTLFNCKATANTTQTGSLLSLLSAVTLEVGDRLAIRFAGTVTTLAGVSVSVHLRYL